MSKEATIRSYLKIRKASGELLLIDYTSPGPTGFSDDVAGSKGPSPGAQTILAGGKIISLDELDTPGWCVIKNNSSTVTVEYGIRDPETGRYYPFGEIPPGCANPPFKFSRNFREEFIGTGTGTTSDSNQLFMKPIGGSDDCNVSVEIFEA